MSTVLQFFLNLEIIEEDAIPAIVSELFNDPAHEQLSCVRFVTFCRGLLPGFQTALDFIT